MAALPEEPAEVAAVKPDPEAGTPPQPPAAPPAAAAAAPAAPPAAAVEVEAAGNGGETAPPKQAAPGPAASPAALDRQTLVAVLQFLRRSNLRESEEILRREARLLGDDLGAAALSPAGAGLLGAPGGDADSAGGEALLSRVTAAAAIAIGGSVATVASSSPGVAAVAAVPPGKGGARAGTVGSLCRAGPVGAGGPLCLSQAWGLSVTRGHEGWCQVVLPLGCPSLGREVRVYPGLLGGALAVSFPPYNLRRDRHLLGGAPPQSKGPKVGFLSLLQGALSK